MTAPESRGRAAPESPSHGPRIHKAFRSDIFRLGVGTVALAVAPGVAGVLAARSLGATGRGELAVALALATVAGSVGMRGLDTAMLADSTESDDRAKRVLVVHRAGGVVVLEGLAAGILASLVLGSLHVFLSVSVALAGSATTLFLLTRSLNIAGRRFADVLRADLLAAVVMLAGSVLASALSIGPEGYVWAAIAGLALGAICGVRAVPGSMRVGAEAVVRVRAGLVAVGRPAWATRVLQAAAFRLDRVVLAALAGAGAAGIYAAVLPFAEMATIVPLHLSQMATSRIAQSDGGLRWFDLRESRLALVAAVTAIGLVVLVSGPLVGLVYGDEFGAGVSALRLLAVASLVSVVWRFNESELFGRRRPKGAVVSTAVAAFLVIFGTVGLSSLGADGAALASLIGYTAALALSSRFVRAARHG